MEGHRPGYSYRYRFSTDDEILSLYKDQFQWCYGMGARCFVVETRTNFILKPTGVDAGAEEIVDSERFASVLPVCVDEVTLGMCTGPRLSEYWMPLKEIERLAHETLCFSKRMEVDPQNASLFVIPIAVDIDVCTVQLRGESLDATAERAIKPDCLMPFYISMFGVFGRRIFGSSMVPSGEGIMEDEGLRLYLLELPKDRVEDVGNALARMKVCPVCRRPPTFGAVLTTLPCDDNHVFHNHCIIRKLLLNKSCPQCHFKIVTTNK